jgi:hypothetical protein
MTIVKPVSRRIVDPTTGMLAADWEPKLSALFGNAGRSTVTGTFTLNAGTTSTTVSVTGATASSVFLGAPTPTTANAANDMATTSYAMGSGQFVVTHANNARVDRTFSYAILL